MRKLTLFTFGMLLPALMMAAPAWAGVIGGFTGNTTFTFSGPGAGATAKLSWAVYTKNDTTFVNSPGNYTYVYTIDNISGVPVDAYISVWDIAVNDPPIAGHSDAGGTILATTGTLSTFGSLTKLKADFITTPLSNSGDSSFYFLSSYNPLNSTSGSSMVLDGTVSDTFTSNALIMRPGTESTPPPPGVPEPETWALLIMLSGFTMWWVRRRQDEDVIEENFTA